MVKLFLEILSNKYSQKVIFYAARLNCIAVGHAFMLIFPSHFEIFHQGETFPTYPEKLSKMAVFML